MSFTDKQRNIIHYDNRFSPVFTILEGAVRSGKTYVLLFLWIKHISEFKNQNKKFIMTGYTIPTLKANILDEMYSLFNIDTTLDSKNTFNLFGNKIHCYGTDKVDSWKRMRGITAYGWLANEVTLQHQNSIKQAIERCSGEGSRTFWDTNPDHPQHPVKKEFIDKSGDALKNGKERIKSWHFVLDDNPFLPEEYVENLKLSIPSGVQSDRDIKGLWVAAEGMIYQDFNYEVNVIRENQCQIIFNDFIAGVDWGYDHMGVIGVYGIDGDGKYYRIYEVAERKKNTDWWLSKGKEVDAKHPGVVFYADPSKPEIIDSWRSAGLNIRGAHNAVFFGITTIASKFKNEQLFIVKEANGNYLSEIFDYRWKPGAREEPIKEKDDSMDSERYAIYSREWENRAGGYSELKITGI